MRITPDVVQDLVNCDVCGESCNKDYNLESAQLYADWGYESAQDLTTYDIDLCEPCFMRTMEFLRSIRTKKVPKDECDPLNPGLWDVSEFTPPAADPEAQTEPPVQTDESPA